MYSNAKPSGASSPFVTGQQLDAWGAVVATDADVTSAQRVIEIGAHVPIVFGKAVDGDGGVWVTPAAARFGAQAHPTNGTNVSIGMVVSDGRIGDIAAADVYKGAARINELLDWKTAFAYGSMPEAGFDYTLSNTTVETKQEFINGSMTTTFSITRSNAMSVSVSNLKVMTGAVTQYFAWRVYVNGVLHSSNPGLSVTAFSFSQTWSSPSSFTLELTSYNGAVGRPYDSTATVMGEVVHTYPQTGAPQEGASELPIYAGSGGTFEDLSCLAVRARTAKVGGTQSDSDASRSLSEPITTSTDISFPSTTRLSIPRLEVKSGVVVYQFRYQLLVNGAIAQDSGQASYANWYNINLSLAARSSVILRVISFYGGEGKPIPGGATVLGQASHTQPGAVTGGTTPLGYEDQVRCFVRNGVHVESVLTGATGSSNNFADLALHLVRKSGRVPDRLVDFDSFRLAAKFTEANQLFFNGVISAPVNLREYLQRVAPYFLLKFAQVDGRFALLPVVQTKIDGAIDGDPLTPRFELSATSIVSSGLRWNYVPASQRQDIIALVSWRNQSSATYSVSNVAEVRYAATPTYAPTERHDISDFCTSSNHATMFGKYLLATKKHITHTVDFDVPQSVLPGVRARDVVAIDFSALPSFGTQVGKRVLYRVESVAESESGLVRLTGSHTPVDGHGNDEVVVSMLQGTHVVA